MNTNTILPYYAPVSGSYRDVINYDNQRVVGYAAAALEGALVGWAIPTINTVYNTITQTLRSRSKYLTPAQKRTLYRAKNKLSNAKRNNTRSTGKRYRRPDSQRSRLRQSRRKRQRRRRNRSKWRPFVWFRMPRKYQRYSSYPHFNNIAKPNAPVIRPPVIAPPQPLNPKITYPDPNDPWWKVEL